MADHWLAMLSSADAGDPNANNLLVLVLSAALVVGVIALALVPIVRSRHHRHGDIIRVLTFFWGLTAAVVAFRTTTQQLNWSSERVTRLQSGYYSQAQVDQGAPGWPIITLAAVTLGYAGLVVWAFLPMLPVASVDVASPTTPAPTPAEPLPSTPPTDV